MSTPVTEPPVRGSVEEFVAIFDRWTAGKRAKDPAVTLVAAGELRGWIWSTIRQDPAERDTQMDRVLTEAYARGLAMGRAGR